MILLLLIWGSEASRSLEYLAFAKIKSSYKVIPNVNLMKLVKESEFKYSLKNFE